MKRSKKISYHSCSVKHCGKNSVKNEGVSFFTLPKDPERRAMWIENCFPEITELDGLRKDARVCQEHFEDLMFLNINKKNRLTDFAVPTRFSAKILAERESLESNENYLDMSTYLTCQLHSDPDKLDCSDWAENAAQGFKTKSRRMNID